jgi:hypothetical protein
MSSYQVLKHDIWSGGLKLDELKGFDEDFLLGGGESLLATYPTKVSYSVDAKAVTKSGPARGGAKTKASTQLTDSLRNINGHLVVSARMKALVAPAELHIEFLPVAIQRYRERYFIVNLLEHVPCLDEKKSKLRKDGGEVRGITKLVLDTRRIPADRALFQVKDVPALVIVRDDLARVFDEASLTGMERVDLDKYDDS